MPIMQQTFSISSHVVQFRFCYDDDFQAMDCQQGKAVADCQKDDITLPPWQKTSTAVA